jgi:putative ABC transport system permease protein
MDLQKRGTAMLAGFFGDLKYALRTFVRRPLFTSVVLLTLALGIGSNVAIFSVVDAVLFRPLPYGNPEQLALVWTRLPATNVDRSLVSGPDMQDYIRETRLFAGFAGAVAFAGTLTGDGPAEQIMNGYATWNIFEVLGVKPMLGRSFRESDAFPVDPKMFGTPNPDLPPGTVMLTYGLWQRRFGGDPAVLGRTIQMDGWGSVVVGVLPRDFRIYLPADAGMPTNIEAWGVLPSNISDFARDAPWLTVVSRLKAGVTVDQAQGEMNTLAARLREVHQFHKNQNLQIVVAGMHGDVVKHARAPLLALLGAVGFVLLIACANVANLLLVRATGRGREIAVRAALGSGHGRIILQMLTESAVLAIGGAALGLLLGWWGVRVIAALSPGNLPRLENVSLDGSVLLFTAGVTVLAAIIFGLAPTLRAVSGNLAASLKDRGSVASGVRGSKLRTALVVTEMALSLILLIGAGLMLRSFAAMGKVEPGFDAENVVTLSAPITFTKYYSTALRTNFVNDLGARLGQIPGVERVGGVAPLPLTGGEQYSVGSYGRVGDPDNVYQANKADFRAVLPGYFETMRIALIAGRTLVPADNQPKALPVAVIDEKLARRAFGDEDPLGKELVVDHFSEETFSLERARVQVVGVVANVRSTSLAAEGRETIYTTYVFNSFLPINFVVRTAASPESLVGSVREVVTAMDPDVPVSGVATLESYVTNAMAPTRFMLALIGVFAGVALVLASLGLYGVISYSVRERTREFGVRVAFGARARDVLQLVLRQGMMVATIGILLGVAAAFALTRIMVSLLVGVSPTDFLTFAAVPALLLTVALVATFIPARRATLIDPVDALRQE